MNTAAQSRDACPGPLAGHERTIRDLTVFLERWLQRHPSFKRRAFFVTGESFAGDKARELLLSLRSWVAKQQ